MEAVINGIWKELREILDDIKIHEESLDDANDTHWVVYDLHVAVD